MNTFYPNVPDESLFLLMSQGSKEAQDILLRRYVHLGRQIAGVLIRQRGLRNTTDEYFIPVIYETIFKSFRYYRINDCQYFLYCRELLNQSINSEADIREEELEQDRATFYLDDFINGSTNTYHEIVSDDETSLTVPEIADVNEFLEHLSSTNSPKKRKLGRIYIMYQMGYTITEIVEKLQTTQYTVRKVLGDPQKYIDGIKDNLNMK